MTVRTIGKETNPNLFRMQQLKTMEQTVCDQNTPLAKVYEARKMLWATSNRFDVNCSNPNWCLGGLKDKKGVVDRSISCVTEAEKRNDVSWFKRLWRRNFGDLSKPAKIQASKTEEYWDSKLPNPNIERLVQLRNLRIEICKPGVGLKEAYELQRRYHGILKVFVDNQCEPRWSSQEHDRELQAETKKFYDCLKKIERQNNVSDSGSGCACGSARTFSADTVPRTEHERRGKECRDDYDGYGGF